MGRNGVVPGKRIAEGIVIRRIGIVTIEIGEVEPITVLIRFRFILRAAIPLALSTILF